MPARLDERDHIVRPCAFIEVHREEPAGLILEKRVHAHHVSAGEVTDYSGVVEPDERLIRTVAALHFGQLAYAPDELVLARWRITALPGLFTHEPRREDIHSSAK